MRLHSLKLRVGLLLIGLSVTGTSCSGPVRRTVMYVRAYRAPIEAKGHMRIAQDRVWVNIVGTDEVVELEAPGAYQLLHEHDAAGVARDLDRLDRCDRAGRVITEAEAEAARAAEKAAGK